MIFILHSLTKTSLVPDTFNRHFRFVCLHSEVKAGKHLSSLVDCESGFNYVSQEVQVNTSRTFFYHIRGQVFTVFQNGVVKPV